MSSTTGLISAPVLQVCHFPPAYGIAIPRKPLRENPIGPAWEKARHGSAGGRFGVVDEDLKQVRRAALDIWRHNEASCSAYSALIFDRNSPFALVLLNLSISNSIASTGDSGFSTFRSTQIRDKSSRGISNSSLRVPER